MGLYIGNTKYTIAKVNYRGFWLVTVYGINGTTITCGTSKLIDESGYVTFKFVEAGTYTFVATNGENSKTTSVVLSDTTGVYYHTIYMNVLPAGYTTVQYVDTEAGAMADSGIIPTTATGLIINMTFSLNSIVSGTGVVNGLWGYMKSSQQPRFAFYAHNGKYGAGLNNTYYSSVACELDVRTTTKYDSGAVYINDTQVMNIGAGLTGNDSMPIYIGGRGNENGVNAWPSDSKIYAFDITYNGVKRTFYPAIRDSDNAIGFFSTLTGDLITSVTSTSFSAGPE